jgi:hypothetical protein
VLCGAHEVAVALEGCDLDTVQLGDVLGRATEHAALCDALARVPRGRAGVRVEVDPQSV